MAGIVVVALTVGRSGRVEGDATPDSTSDASTSTTSDTSTGPLPPRHDPTEPYDLGPHAIPYEQLSAAEQSAVDLIQETVEITQPPSSHEQLAAGAASARQRLQAELAARRIGLVGTDQDGMVEP